MASLAMGPAVVDITGVRAGDRNIISLELTTDGVPWNLTGATLTAHGKLNSLDPTPAIEAVLTPVDEATGKYQMAWDGDDVRSLVLQDEGGNGTWNGVWDLQVLEAGQTLADTVAAGKLSCEMDVTQ